MMIDIVARCIGIATEVKHDPCRLSVISKSTKLKETPEMFIVRHARPIILSGALALVAGMQPGAAKAEVINTYSGGECLAATPGGAANLTRLNGAVTASAPTEVRCPIVKNIFNSTARVESGVVASGGTTCELRSYNVFTTSFKRSNISTFPGTSISAINFAISSRVR
jgi:hypothetical protein